MSRVVCLLRGINVGGRNKLAMTHLRALIEGLGASSVSTYIQSGNIVFDFTRGAPAMLEKELSKVIDDSAGFAPSIFILKASSFVDILDANPFAEKCEEPKSLHVMFLRARPAAAKMKLVRDTLITSEEIANGPRAIYFFAPDGIARSKAAETISRMFPEGTMRNWRTCLAIKDMAIAS